MENSITEEINSYLVFNIGKEEFAAHASKVQRILEMQPITTMPKAHPYMKGVINLMGSVLPIIDARLKMGMDEKEYDTNTCVIVLEVEKEGTRIETGIIVDAVQSVIEITKEDIKDSPSIGNTMNEDFIKGMVHKDNKFIMVLDIDNVFSKEEVININESTEVTSEQMA